MPMSKRPALLPAFEWMVAIILTVAALLLHLTRLFQAGALWRDEAAAVNLATQPSFAELWHGLSFEIMPAFPPLVIRLWATTHWGATDLGLRTLGCLVGGGIVAAVWWNARCLSQKPPMVSLLLLGLSGLVVRWGDSLRGHGLGLFFLLICYGLIWKVLESPGKLRVSLAGAAAVLSLQCSYQNAPMLAAVCGAAMVAALRRAHWPIARTAGGIGVVAALSLLPYLAVLRRAQEWTMLIKTSVTLPELWRELANALSPTRLLVIWTALLVVSLGLSAFFLAAPKQLRSDAQSDLLWFASFSLLAGIVGFALYATGAGYLNVWHFLPVLGIAAVSMDVIVDSLGNIPWVRPFRLLAVVAAAAVLWPPAWSDIHIRPTNVDGVARMLNTNAEKNDLIVVDPWYIAVSFQRYYTGSIPWTSMPPMVGVGIHRYDLLKAKMMSENPAQPILDQMARTLKSGNRVWFVGIIPPPPNGNQPPSLKPAPNQGFWNDDAYTLTWSLQEGFFIRNHATGVEPLNPPDDDLIGSENVSLIKVWGWRTSPNE